MWSRINLTVDIPNMWLDPQPNVNQQLPASVLKKRFSDKTRKFHVSFLLCLCETVKIYQNIITHQQDCFENGNSTVNAIVLVHKRQLQVYLRQTEVLIFQSVFSFYQIFLHKDQVMQNVSLIFGIGLEYSQLTP